MQARLDTLERSLTLFPNIGAPSRHDPKLRRIALRPFPYLIFYEVTETEVWIHRIRHFARKPDETS